MSFIFRALVKRSSFVKSIQKELTEAQSQLIASQSAYNAISIQLENFSNVEQQLIGSQQEMVNSAQALKEMKEKFTDKSQELHCLQSRYENIPSTIIESCVDSDFHVFKKIQCNFSSSEIAVLVDECGFSGWEVSLDTIVQGFEEVLHSSVNETVSNLNECLLKKIEILDQNQSDLDEEIAGIEYRLKSTATPISVIEETVHPLQAYKTELEKQCQRWIQLHTETKKMASMSSRAVKYSEMHEIEILDELDH